MRVCMCRALHWVCGNDALADWFASSEGVISAGYKRKADGKVGESFQSLPQV
ncbi:Hypothetical protein FKW44_006280 [Caligus rogercresseyi]|uniref:Uncharacterized protein n=1 Tax=Caligus rogercresseyi TaxID=217165 RepID=A0A7T8KD68_CALRO|nr:Hypothetical protein FKW44_006280 [Caligus rogercresseyi]